VQGSDRRGIEQVGSGANMLQAFFEIGRCLVARERFHDNGRRDGIGQRFQEREFQAGQQILLSAEEDAHAGLAVVLEVQQLPEFDQDVVGQAMRLVDDKDRMHFVRAVERKHVVLDGAE